MAKATKKGTAQKKLMVMLSRLANLCTPGKDGNVPLESGHLVEVGYIAGRALTLARKVFNKPACKGTASAPAARS